MDSTFTKLLNCNGQSITHIDVKVQPGDVHLLEKLLIRCPKLKIIKYQQRQLSQEAQQPFHDKCAFSENLLDQQQQDQQRPLFSCLESITINGVAPIHQLLNNDIDIPNLRYLNIFCPYNNNLEYIRDQGWPQLRFLQLMGILWTPELLSNLSKAILNMPLLESIHFISNIPSTNELYTAIAGLEHLKALFIDNQRYYTGELREEDEVFQDTEEGLLCLLRGKCRQSLQKLQLNAVNVLTDRILDAIPDWSDRMTCLSLVLRVSGRRQWQLQQQRQGTNHGGGVGLLTDLGLRRFASSLSENKMDYLGLFMEFRVATPDTIMFILDKLGPNFASNVIYSDIVGCKRYLKISSDGIWSVHDRNGLIKRLR
ncbi:hypothetical protein BDB00DRAFT_875569 [Zychaea mexicana]|uniref:uncharacterized protein n=1 Tax=Zychaea mexicana TaxID=64656 RepID=UPI0022FED6A8|nr:uncharacterized protein BDB00DRAFT_875569 [Zychaea mexicana]KAI9490254.1 hypothetical protein BDB00DRAFT_875569 [Zychaea mexicana]